MSHWSHIVTFLITVAVPLAIARHINQSAKKTNVRHESQRAEEERNFPRSHLRLHSRPPHTLPLREGASHVLECQAGGSPLPRVYWLKNGEQVSQIYLEDELSPKAIREQGGLNLGSTSSRLYLDCVTMEDEAEYTCVAENTNHRESTTTRVTVSSSDDKECRERFGETPRILSWTKTALEVQGRDIRVICRTEGQPTPTVKWLNPLEEEINTANDPKYEIFPNGDLVIRKLKWRDMGNYVCVAENTYGSARAEVFVYPTTPET